MHKGRVTSTLLILVLILVVMTCTSCLEPTVTPSPEPTDTVPSSPTPAGQAVSISGPDCPDSFQGSEQINRNVEIGANGVLTLTLGSNPSIPCGWQAPQIEDPDVVHQVDHQSRWPAEGVTPMPGAPGTEIWVFEVVGEGESTISFPCICLGEEGAEEEKRGTFMLNVGNNE